LSLTGGFGDLDKDKFNLLFALAHSESQALRSDQRSFVNTLQSSRGLSPDTTGAPFATVTGIASLASGLTNKTTTGPIMPGGTQSNRFINVLALPGGPGCNSVPGMAPYDWQLWGHLDYQYACTVDTGVAAVMQQPVTNNNLVARGTLKLGEHQLFAEVTAAQVTSAKTFSASQLSSSSTATLTNGLPAGFGQISIANPLYNLAYPSTGASYNAVASQLIAAFPQLAGATYAGKPLAFKWRCLPCGPREYETSSDTSRFLVGADGPLPWLKDWDYRAGVSIASSDASSTLGNGYYFGAPLAALINTGVLN
jgi:iron complex outermembrane receptor protein